MVQFGITLVSLLTGVYGGTEMAGPLSKYVAKIPGLENYAYTISLTGIVAFITYLTIILGEIVPKRIAIDKPEKSPVSWPGRSLYFPSSVRLSYGSCPGRRQWSRRSWASINRKSFPLRKMKSSWLLGTGRFELRGL